ncbi:molybdenum cofactor guanylyltransferase [Zunongwangia sp. H14]|uniref:molybdenum cofactor guanylyltransferase n=1 Tax=Zunongwangia sp. H14 TaxID=3240792 RepID=UPI0035630982
MINKNTISAFVLCGGKSSRMGTEKGLISYKGSSFIEWSIKAIEPFTSNIKLVTGNKDYEQFPYPLLKDDIEEKGPAGAIFTALKTNTSDWNLFLSCDMPGILPWIIEYLITNADPQASVSFLNEAGRDYPLAGLYHQKCLPVFSEAIKEGNLRLMKILEKVDFKRVEMPASQKRFLNNVNTKEELEHLINTPYEDSL